MKHVLRLKAKHVMNKIKGKTCGVLELDNDDE